MNTVITLHNAAQGHSAFAGIWQAIKPYLLAGHKLQVRVEPERRNGDQNALLHALLGEVAAEREWAGKKRDIETWKRLLVASWCRARGEAVELLPALDGHGVDIVFRRTSKMSKAEVSELVDYIQAWRATA